MIIEAEMKVLFVSSGNSKDRISPIIKNQGESLLKCNEDINIDYYSITGKGFIGYIKNIIPLKRKIYKEKFNVIHAHYSLSAYISSFSSSYPLVVSLMGSDVKSNYINKIIIRLIDFFYRWKVIIVKSEDMKKSLGISRALVIPNGVDLDLFRPLDKFECQFKLGWNHQKRHILFASNPSRKEKNFSLVTAALNHLSISDIVLHSLMGIPNKDTPMWYNATDILILTSLWEGSPNVIKEAMACNVPTVATKVGDIDWLFGDEEGYFLTSFDEKDCAKQIEKAIEYVEKRVKTNGRKRIIELGLDSETVAENIYAIYRSIQ